jgi:hypothetical protein
MYFLIIGVAAFVDGLATGVWVGKKWVSKDALTAAVEAAATRATTMPSGGLATVATEVADDVKATADKVAAVVSATTAAADTITSGAASLQKLLATAHVTK